MLFSEVQEALFIHLDSGWSSLWPRAQDPCLISQDSAHSVKTDCALNVKVLSLLDVGSSPCELADLSELIRR